MSESAHVLPLAKDAQDLLFRSARTANTFTADPVSDQQLRAVYDLVKYGPTSMNMQPLRMTALRSPHARARLVPLMSEGNREKTAAAPLTVILSTDTDFHEHLPRLFPPFPGARDMFAGDEAGRASQAVLNGALQIAYFIVGVRAAGLAAGPMTGFDAAAVTEEFLSGTAQKALVVVNIGKPGPNAWQERLPRLEYEEVVTEL